MKCLLTVLPLVLTSLLAAPTLAQDAAERARQSFSQGVAALERGAYQEAEGLFLRSYEDRPHAATLCNLGLTYERWGRLPDAVQQYRRCASEDDTGDYREHAQDRAMALSAELGPAPPPSAPSESPAMIPVIQPNAASGVRPGGATVGYPHGFVVPAAATAPPK